MEDEHEQRELVERLANKALWVSQRAGVNFRDPSTFAVINAAVRDVILEEFPRKWADLATRVALFPKVMKAIGRSSEDRAQERDKNWDEFQERKRGGPFFGGQ